MSVSLAGDESAPPLVLLHGLAERRQVFSWIVPLLDSIESGDMTRIRQYYEFEKGHEMESPNVKS